MITETGLQAVTVGEFPHHRRRGAERRAASERRRSARGLFEVRARREGFSIDRRRGERREETGRSWWGFWRRVSR